MDKPVIDQTGLKGFFSFPLPIMPGTGNDLNTRLGDDGATLAEGFRGIGLKLEPAKAPVSRLVIDHIERPPAN